MRAEYRTGAADRQPRAHAVMMTPERSRRAKHRLTTAACQPICYSLANAIEELTLTSHARQFDRLAACLGRTPAAAASGCHRAGHLHSGGCSDGVGRDAGR